MMEFVDDAALDRYREFSAQTRSCYFQNPFFGTALFRHHISSIGANKRTCISMPIETL